MCDVSVKQQRKSLQGALKSSKFLKEAKNLLLTTNLPPCLAANLSMRSKMSYEDAQEFSEAPLSAEKYKEKDCCEHCWMPMSLNNMTTLKIQNNKKCPVCNYTNRKRRKTENTVSADVETVQVSMRKTASATFKAKEKKKASKLSRIVAVEQKTTGTSLTNFLSILK